MHKHAGNKCNNFVLCKQLEYLYIKYYSKMYKITACCYQHVYAFLNVTLATYVMQFTCTYSYIVEYWPCTMHTYIAMHLNVLSDSEGYITMYVCMVQGQYSIGYMYM